MLVPGKNRSLSSLIVLLILIIPVFGISLSLGTANLSVYQVFKTFFSWLFSGVSDGTAAAITIRHRLPRIILGFLCGAGLSVSGLVLQSLFHNPLSDPYTLGLSSGSALGVTILILLGIAQPFLIQLGAFLGGLSSLFLVLSLSKVFGIRADGPTLLLSGISVNFFFSATISLLMYINHDQVHKILFWTFGTLGASSWEKVAIIVVPISLGVVLITGHWKSLNLLLQGDDMARSLGIDPGRKRLILLIIAALITASAVSMTGIIGFVGLLVPHVFRIIFGSNAKGLIPLSAVGGGIFLVLADTIGRIILSPSELPVGIITALVGAPYLLFLLVFQAKRRSHA